MLDKLWQPLRLIKEEAERLNDDTYLLLLRHHTRNGNEYKLLEYYADEEQFYNPALEEYEDLNVYQSDIDYINLEYL